MKERIRATDAQQFIDWFLGLPNWNWDEWDALPHILAPALFLTGELEDPDDETAKAAATMPNGTRFRIPGQGHQRVPTQPPRATPGNGFSRRARFVNRESLTAGCELIRPHIEAAEINASPARRAQGVQQIGRRSRKAKLPNLTN
jgi:hypothetical protein